MSIEYEKLHESLKRITEALGKIPEGITQPVNISYSVTEKRLMISINVPGHGFHAAPISPGTLEHIEDFTNDAVNYINRLISGSEQNLEVEHNE